MKYVFNAIFTKENKGYSVLCPELGVASQGTDLKQAEANIQEGVKLYIRDIPQDELVPYSQAESESLLIRKFEVSHA